MIRHGFSPRGERLDINSIDNTNTEIITLNNRRGVIIDEWEKLETIASNALLFHFTYFIFYFSFKSCNFIIIIN